MISLSINDNQGIVVLIGRALYQTSAQQSNPDFVTMWAGQGAALAEALSAGELIEKMVQEFQAVTASLQLS